MGAGFWLRWTWRDLRHRWRLVAAIGLTIALGTGAYAGLGSTSAWARATYDRNYADLAMYDLRIVLSAGSFVHDGELADVAGAALGPDLAAVEERLILPIQVDASTEDEAILVPGSLVGVPLDGGGPDVNRLAVDRGRALAAADAGEPTALLEAHFARHYELPASGEVLLSGRAALTYVGHAFTPEYFMVTTEGGGVLAERNFAAIFTSVATAQAVSGRADAVNDAVIVLADGADLAAAQRAVERELAASIAATATVMVPDDDPAYHTLYRDIDSDAVFFRVFATLLLAGAALGAFNLTGRIAEAQRREIGVAMSLGASAWRIALRPMLVAGQIAVLGAIMGVGVGLLIGQGMRGVFDAMVPMPTWITPFRADIYAGAAALGFAVPFAASLYPILRAVRVPPIQAIRTALTAAHGSASRLRLAPARGGVVARMPLRNVLRTPRRTILTALGIGAAVAVLTATGGTVDTMTATIDRGEAALMAGPDDRVSVALDGFLPAAPVLDAVRAVPEVGRAEPGLRVAATATGADDEIELALELIDMDEGIWVPEVADAVDGAADEGIVLSEKAMRDLGLSPGDAVLVEHPLLVNATTLSTASSEMTVIGSHRLPLRFSAFADLALAGRMGLGGVVNALSVLPAEGAGTDDVAEALFGMPGVASVQPERALVDVFRAVVEEYLGILAIAELVAVILAVAIAYNAASISFDERVREHATMFAFGTSVGRVLALVVAELAIIGAAAALLGLAAGRLILGWLLASVLPTTFPDFGFVLAVAPLTVGAAVVTGVVAVGLAPLLGARRLARMDVPGALRFVE